MKYTATLTITGEPKLAAYLTGECRKESRSQIRIEHDKMSVVVFIEANDAVALRSCFNTIGQALSVWEKL